MTREEAIKILRKRQRFCKVISDHANATIKADELQEVEAIDMAISALRSVSRERVAKTPERIAYAIKQFEGHGIEYALKNEQTGHFHCWRKSDDKLFQFYAGTGKIQGYDRARGIHALIKLLEKEAKP